MVVQESEVALDGFQTELLESQHDAKEQEVKVHNGVMHVLQLYNGESKGSHSDKRDRAAEEQVFAHLLEGALVLLRLGGFPPLFLAHLGIRTILLFIGRVIFQVRGHVVAVPWTTISLLKLLSLLLQLLAAETMGQLVTIISRHSRRSVWLRLSECCGASTHELSILLFKKISGQVLRNITQVLFGLPHFFASSPPIITIKL